MSDRIREALQFIPSSDRDTWVKMGMAVKSELGDAGFHLWEDWSQQADTFNAKDARDVWKSIRINGKVTAGTLFHEAKANGWRDDGTHRKPTPEELAAHQRINAEHAAQEEARTASERAEAARKSEAVWKAASEAKPDHPYLVRKQVSPVATLREIDADAAAAFLGYAPKSSGEPLAGRLLVAPVKVGGRLSTLELIDEEGRKSAVYGGAKAGGYWAAQQLHDGDGLTLLIGEGVATVLTAKESSGHPAIAALSAGNLSAVAKAMRERYPTAALVILADLVKATGAPDPHAVEAAKSIGGKLATPDFGTGRPDSATDFNDLAIKFGSETVERCITNAVVHVLDGGQAKTSDRVKVAGVAKVAAVQEPEPLRAVLPPAEPYPVDMLGDVLGGAAKALHDSVKAPLAMCCQSVLAAASLAVQPHYDIKLPWGELKPLSLFMLTVGESGERKSGIDDLVLGAAKAQERADMEAYAHERERYTADMAAWKQATDAASKVTTGSMKGRASAADIRAAVERCGDKPTAPVAPLRFVSDPTVEGLYKLLVVGQPSVALFSDEGGLLIGGHALNSDNALKTMARWCKLWDGSPFDRVRADDGAGVLYGRRMALHQLAQPDVMITLLSNRMANGQGLLARCLVAWPESTIGNRHIERFEWAGDRKELKRLFAALKSLMEAQPRVGNAYQELDPIELPLSDDAREVAVAAGNEFESLMAKGADLAELRDRTSKALENACRIAGVLAVVDGGLATRIIEVEHLQRALVLVQWYLAEALRIRGATSVSQSVMDAEALSAWLKDRGITNFRSKQVLNAGPNQLRDKARLMAAIRELVTCGYLETNDPGTLVDGVKAKLSWRVLHHVV